AEHQWGNVRQTLRAERFDRARRRLQGTRGDDVVHTAAIALEYLVIVSQQGQELLHDLRRLAARRDAVVHPLLFAKTIEQTRARKDLEMPRHARLALPEDLAKLAH